MPPMMMLRKYQHKKEERAFPKDRAKTRAQTKEPYQRVFDMVALKTDGPNPWEVLKQKPSFQLSDVTLHDIVYAMQHASTNLDVNEEEAKRDLDFLGNAYLAKIEVMHHEVRRKAKGSPKPVTQEEQDIAKLEKRSRDKALEQEENISYNLIVACEQITNNARKSLEERMALLSEPLQELERVTDAFEKLPGKKLNFFQRLIFN